MIECENVGHVAVVKMVKGRGNAIDREFLEAIDAALRELEESPVRSIVLTGQGSVFGAGIDLVQMLAKGESYVREFLPFMSDVFKRLATYPKPIVAAVNGHAIAGGAIIMLACDQRILAKGKAKVGLSEVLVGVTFPAWAIEIARFALPTPTFATAVSSGRSYSAEDALAKGFVDELLEPEQLLSRAIEVAEEWGRILPETFAATKLAVRRPLLDAVALTQKDDDKIVAYWSTPKVQDAIRSFAERMIGKGK